MRAEQYAEKMCRETGEAPWAVKKGRAPLGPSPLDPELLVKRIGIMERQHRALMEAFPAPQVLDLEYEAINADLPKAVERLRRHLGIPQAPYAVPFEKATPDDLRAAIVNYEAVRARLAQDGYDGLLMEGVKAGEAC